MHGNQFQTTHLTYTFVRIYSDLIITVHNILITDCHLLNFHALLHAYRRVVELK